VKQNGCGKKSKALAKAAPRSESEQLRRLAQVGELLRAVQCGELTGLEVDGSSSERSLVHGLAEPLGLEHESLGNYPRRHLYVQRPYTVDDSGNDHDGGLFLVWRMGHLFVEGPAIDALGRLPSARVDADPAQRAAREQRDGQHHHITLLHSSVVQQLARQWPPVMRAERLQVLRPYLTPEQLQREVELDTATSTELRPFWPFSHSTDALSEQPASAATSEDMTGASVPPTEATVPVATAVTVVISEASAPSPLLTALQQLRLVEEVLLRFFAARATAAAADAGPCELGLGRVAGGPTAAAADVAYFRVLEWPALAAARRLLGLPPADLHITVGFAKNDVHGVAKGRHTLCEMAEDE